MTIDAIADNARTAALQNGGHVPTVIAEGSSNSTVLVFEAFSDTSDGRALQMYSAGVDLGRQNPIGELLTITFISEAWMSGAVNGKLPSVPPSKDPQRTEALIVTRLAVKTRASEFRAYQMLRDKGHRLKGLAPVHTDTAGLTSESPLLSAFVRGFSVGEQTPRP